MMKSNYFLEKAREQARWRLQDSINLLPSENVTSPQVRALLSSDFGHRYTLPVNSLWAGEYIENSYRGTKITTEIERSAERVACEVFRSRYACVQPLSGHIAAMIALASLTSRGDAICSVSVADGGYDGYSRGYLPDIFGLDSWDLPFDKRKYNINSVKASRMIRSKRPRMVLLGASFILFPYEIAPIKDACEETGSILAYDGSHVLGLIAGGEFQEPLKGGVDVLFGSTHKSYFGPQGGLILTNDEEINARIRKNLTWRTVDNIHWNRVAALGQSLLEMKRFGNRYAKQVIRNARCLGEELSERGFPLMYEKLGFTRSHQLLIDRRRLRRRYGLSMNDFSVRLERSNLIIDSVGRLGTAEITRYGFVEKDVSRLADIFIQAASGRDMRRQVRKMRGEFSIKYIL